MNGKVKIVDRDNKVVELVERAQLNFKSCTIEPNSKRFVKAASLFFLNTKNQILVQKRDSKTDYYPNCFDFSVAGLEYENENSLDCIVRSVERELNQGSNSCFHFCFSLLPKEQEDAFYHDVYFAQITDLKAIGNQFHWINFDSLIMEMEENHSQYAPAFRLAISKFSRTRKILIIDDNPIPTIKTVETLLLRFSKSEETWDEYIKGKTEFNQWEELKRKAQENHCYDDFYSKSFTFLEKESLLTIYMYDPKHGENEKTDADKKKTNVKYNNERIKLILSVFQYSYIWMDSGHSAISIILDRSVKLQDEDNKSNSIQLNCGANNAVIEKGVRSNSLDQITDNSLKPYLTKAEQLLVYTYNPVKNHSDIDGLRKQISQELTTGSNSTLRDEDVIVFETSGTIKFYSDADEINGYNRTIKDGTSKGKLFLGTKSAYELYGNLLGNILYDSLKYHLNDFKNEEEKRYNFFNRPNREFLEGIKLLNNQLRFSQGHKLGLVTFQYKGTAEDLQFLLDSPYKSYFVTLNKIIEGNEKLKPIYDHKNVLENTKDWFWVRYIYKYESNNFVYEVNVSDNNLSSLDFDTHLKIVHASLFYSPQIFDSGNFCTKVKSNKEDISCLKKCYEIIYFVCKNEVIKNRDKGILHYILYKPIKTQNEITKDKDIQKIHLNGGKFILTPMVQPTVYPILQKQIERQSTLNAIAVVMARNMSHNIGSHVLSRLVSLDNVDIDEFTAGDNPHYTPYSAELYYNVKIQAIEDSLREQEEQESRCEGIKYKARKTYYNQLISTFFSYLKTRQDFLADVVTSVPQVQSSKQFKKELMEGIDSNRILLNRISGVSDFNYAFHFEGEKLAGDNDLPVAISNDVMGQHAFYIILENIIRNTAKHGGGNVEAVKDNKFTIRVEDSTLDSSYYRVTVFDDRSFNDDDKEYLKLSKKDSTYTKTKERLQINLSTKTLERKDKSKIEEVSKKEWVIAYTERLNAYNGHNPELQFEGSDEDYDYFTIKKIDKLIISQNVWINKPILDGEFKLRQGALGLIEMESCAAYLRRIPVEDIEAVRFELAFDPKKVDENKGLIAKGEKELRILRAVNPRKSNNSHERENVLGYQFYLPKPKKLLILDFKGDEWNELSKNGTCEEDLKKLEDSGILLLNAMPGMERRGINAKWYYHANKIYQHEIMLLIEKDDETEFNWHLLPTRWVTFDEVLRNFKKYKTDVYDKYDKLSCFNYEISTSISNTENAGQIIRETWRTYVHKLFVEHKVQKAWPHGDYGFLFVENNSGRTSPNIGLSTHCFDESRYQTGKFLAVHESRFDYLKDVLTESRNEDKKDKFTTPLKNGNSFDLLSKFVDAALSNVCVIDERIQAQALSNSYTTESSDKCPNGTTKPYQYWWNLQNVFVPQKGDFDLSQTDFPTDLDTNINKVLKAEFLNCKREIKGLKWLIIHLGVIEKIAVKNGLQKDTKKDRKKVIENITANFKDVKIIITSGRAPKDLPEDVGYLSYSVISQYLIENRFKLLLNEVLNAARPKIIER